MIFLVYWIISATSVKATAERQDLAGEALHLALLLLGVLLMAASWLGWPANSIPAAHSLVADTLGDLLCVLGLAWAIWARRTLAGNWSSSVAFKLGHELVVHGP
jgi:protein-S-isoprenylcysteine O-methyltransferase Ste14